MSKKNYDKYVKQHQKRVQKMKARNERFEQKQRADEEERINRIIELKNNGDKLGLAKELRKMNKRINELLKQSIKSDGVVNLFSDVGGEFNLFDPKF